MINIEASTETVQPVLIELEPKALTKPRVGFQPGVSGNPAGRAPIVRHVRELAKSHTEEMIGLLLQCARDETERWQVRQTAIQEVLNRGWGKVAHSVDVSMSDSSTPVANMTTEEIQKLLLCSINTTDMKEG